MPLYVSCLLEKFRSLRKAYREVKRHHYATDSWSSGNPANVVERSHDLHYLSGEFQGFQQWCVEWYDIISSLEYIKYFGVNSTLLSPFSQDDMGYDILCYKEVWPTYGSNENCFKRLTIPTSEVWNLSSIWSSAPTIVRMNMRGSKSLGLRRLIMNIIDFSGGHLRVWQRGQSYSTEQLLFTFLGFSLDFWWRHSEIWLAFFYWGPTRPDLNWEDNECRNVIYKDAIGSQVDHDVDGFRIDVGGNNSRNRGLPVASIAAADSKWQFCVIYHRNGPRIDECTRRWTKSWRTGLEVAGKSLLLVKWLIIH